MKKDRFYWLCCFYGLLKECPMGDYLETCPIGMISQNMSFLESIQWCKANLSEDDCISLYDLHCECFKRRQRLLVDSQKEEGLAQHCYQDQKDSTENKVGEDENG